MDNINIGALSNLLEESEKAADVIQSQTHHAPASTFTTVVKSRADVEKEKAAQKEAALSAKQQIFSDKEVLHEDALHIKDANDTRPTPRYEFSYKQMVGTQDTVLGFTDKTPGSQDCSHLIIKIHFPGSQLKDLDLDVTRNRIRAESKTLKLFTYLPNDVYHDKGNAKFDKDKSVLTVTVPIIGMFDDMA